MAKRHSSLVQNIHNVSDIVEHDILNCDSNCEVDLRSRPSIIDEIVLNVGSTKLWFKYEFSNKI